MKKGIYTQIKSAFLLVVFGLNTAVSFACSVGMDMGFNASHHRNEEATEVHVHADGKKHHHEKAGHTHSSSQDKDNCCNESVIKLSQYDKFSPKSNIIINPLFFTVFITTYYSVIDISHPSQVTTSIKYFTRSYHPPISDIRIAIQSFQI